MIICHCEGVTDEDIKKAVSEGARTLDDVILTCDCCLGCQSCVPAVEGIIREAVEGLDTPPSRQPWQAVPKK